MKHKLEVFILVTGLMLGFLFGYIRGYSNGLTAYQMILTKLCDGADCK